MIVTVVVILLIIAGIVFLILGIFVVLHLKGRLKNIPYQRSSRNMSPSQTLGDSKSQEHNETKKMSEASKTAASAIENKQTHETELESQMFSGYEEITIATETPIILKSKEHIQFKQENAVEQQRKSGGTALFDMLKLRLNLKEISGRTFKMVEVKENCKLQDCIDYKRGRVYYEFCHEVESVSEDQELIFMKVCLLYLE